MSNQSVDRDQVPSKAAQAAHRAFHDVWPGPSVSLDLYVTSPIWERIAEAVLNDAADALEGGLGVEGTPRNLYAFRQWLRARAVPISPGES